MKKITVLHNGGGWITNIGNAFLDYGSTELIRQACSEAEVHNTSVLNRWVSYHVSLGIMGRILKSGPGIRDVFNLQENSKIEYITQAGAFLAKHWFDLHGDIFLKLREKGIKVIITGGGMTDSTYDKVEEVEKAREYLKKIKPYVFISRDSNSFKNFSDIAEHSYNGIDCAFFLSDSYKPLELTPPYSVINFDKTSEPTLNELGLDKSEKIVRTHHSFWHNFPVSQYPQMKEYYYTYPNTMISETPEDYLNVYANARTIYTDRIHAAVCAFSYGVPARIFTKSTRSLLFERIGAKDVTKQVVKPNIKMIKNEKETQVRFLSELLR